MLAGLQGTGSSVMLAGVALIALAAGLARGFSGFGAALIFMPPASAIVGPQVAAAVLVLIDLVLAAPLVPKAVPRVALAPLLTMLGGAALTIPAGTWLLKVADPILLRWMIAALAAAMLTLLLSGWRYGGEPKPSVTLLVGAVAGLFAGIAQIAGPPVVAYWLGGHGEASRMRANVILFFAGTSMISIVSYFAGGLITPPVLAWAAVAGPAYGLGLLGGARLFGMASEAAFRRVCFALIALAVLGSLPVWDWQSLAGLAEGPQGAVERPGG